MRRVEVQGTVLFQYPRRWWQLWNPGWYKHTDGLGRKCWIRFQWPQHFSDCAVHNEPAYPADDCDCGAQP